MSGNKKPKFKLGWVIISIGVIFFITGLFDLRETRFGYTSNLLEQGMNFLILGYITLKVDV